MLSYKVKEKFTLALPLGTDCKLVIRTGSPRLRTDPNSEAQVSPLQHAKAPAKQINLLCIASNLIYLRTLYINYS